MTLQHTLNIGSLLKQAVKKLNVPKHPLFIANHSLSPHENHLTFHEQILDPQVEDKMVKPPRASPQPADVRVT